MSYHPSHLDRSPYPTYALDAFGRVTPVGLPARRAPLALADTTAPAPSRTSSALMKIVIGIVVAVVVMAIIYWLWQQMQTQARPVTPNRRRSTKQSTREMARALFKRLEERGGVNETTMRSLQQLGRR